MTIQFERIRVACLVTGSGKRDVLLHATMEFLAGAVEW